MLNKKVTFLVSLLVFMSGFANAESKPNGLVTKVSHNSVKVTLDILEAALTKKGITIFGRIDHQANAKKVGKNLRPTSLLLFGNPKLGTPLMQSSQTVGIDLPMKVLAWEDSRGVVKVLYNDPSYVANRHNVDGVDHVLEKMTKALNALTNKAIAKTIPANQNQ